MIEILVQASNWLFITLKQFFLLLHFFCLSLCLFPMFCLYECVYFCACVRLCVFIYFIFFSFLYFFLFFLLWIQCNLLFQFGFTNPIYLPVSKDLIKIAKQMNNKQKVGSINKSWICRLFPFLLNGDVSTQLNTIISSFKT